MKNYWSISKQPTILSSICQAFLYSQNSLSLGKLFFSKMKIQLHLLFQTLFLRLIEFMQSYLIKRLLLNTVEFCQINNNLIIATSSLLINYQQDMNKVGFRITVFSLLFLTCLCSTNYSATILDSGSSFYKFNLTYTGSQDYYLKPTSPIIKTLVFEIKCYTFNDFSFKIYDPNNPRFEVPQGGLFPQDPSAKFTFPIQYSSFVFTFNLKPFQFSVIRKANNATLFSTFNHDLIFSQYYMEIGTDLDSIYTYGLGQRFTNGFRVKQGTWTIFNRDRGSTIDTGIGGQQTYGFFPVYLQRQTNNLFHMNYLRNSNAMDVVISHKGTKPTLTYKIIGGVFDFRFVVGNQSPQTTVEQFHLIIGRATIPPFWSLGYHQSRWGYENVTRLENVIQNFENYQLPLECIWSDIDYMINFEDFTVDQSKFPFDRMKNITDNYCYIPILDSGIKINQGIPYIQGHKRDVFIKNPNRTEYVGKMRPGSTTFVDFFHPQASQYWQDMLQILHKKVQFSGLWLDMNQYTNYCNGPCTTPVDQKVFDYSKDLPYTPGIQNIQTLTIQLNASHYKGIKEADVHAFAGMLESAATYKYLESKGKTPFIISRSSTFGSQKYAFHWTGDNYASYEFLKGSISDIFNNQIWGFQMVGADICGFSGNTTEQLCARWYQLGSFYPFARNHNAMKNIDQQPYVLGKTVLRAAQNSLFYRYSLLKYYYHAFISQKGVGAIFKPLFFAFPQDNNLYLDQIADTQFMIGSQLLFAPILEQGKTSRTVYFPSRNSWRDLLNGRKYGNGTLEKIKDHNMKNIPPMFIREGGAILLNYGSFRRVKDLKNSFQLIVNMKSDPNSNSTFQRYEAVGRTLSIQDYNDAELIQTCLRSGCQYVLNCSFQVTAQSKQLILDITQNGNINQLIKIQALWLFYGDDDIFTGITPIQIRKAAKIVIPITDPSEKKRNISRQPWHH